MLVLIESLAAVSGMDRECLRLQFVWNHLVIPVALKSKMFLNRVQC